MRDILQIASIRDTVHVHNPTGVAVSVAGQIVLAISVPSKPGGLELPLFVAVAISRAMHTHGIQQYNIEMCAPVRTLSYADCANVYQYQVRTGN